MKKVDFRECTLEYLEDTFGLKPKKKAYTISKGYDASTEHVFDILKILKNLKKIVLNLAKG